MGKRVGLAGGDRKGAKKCCPRKCWRGALLVILFGFVRFDSVCGKITGVGRPITPVALRCVK